MTVDAAPQKRGGLAVLLDTIIAPQAAFAALREQPTWLWAYLATCLLGMIGGYLQVPAAQHITQNVFAHTPEVQQLTPEQQANQLRIALKIQQFTWVIWPIFVILATLFAAIFATIANAVSKGDGTFVKFFALAANIAILNFGLGYLLLGIIAAVRGPAEYSTTRDLLMIFPSPAWLAPGADPKLSGFLAAFNPFQIWSIVLTSLGVSAVGKVSKPVAWTVTIVMVLIGATTSALAIR